MPDPFTLIRLLARVSLFLILFGNIAYVLWHNGESYTQQYSVGETLCRIALFATLLLIGGFWS